MQQHCRRHAARPCPEAKPAPLHPAARQPAADVSTRVRPTTALHHSHTYQQQHMLHLASTHSRPSPAGAARSPEPCRGAPQAPPSFPAGTACPPATWAAPQRQRPHGWHGSTPRSPPEPPTARWRARCAARRWQPVPGTCGPSARVSVSHARVSVSHARVSVSHASTLQQAGVVHRTWECAGAGGTVVQGTGGFSRYSSTLTADRRCTLVHSGACMPATQRAC
jgi:hypothetical protein